MITYSSWGFVIFGVTYTLSDLYMQLFRKSLFVRDMELCNCWGMHIFRITYCLIVHVIKNAPKSNMQKMYA